MPIGLERISLAQQVNSLIFKLRTKWYLHSAGLLIEFYLRTGAAKTKVGPWAQIISYQNILGIF